ncbi:FAD-dependent oxidoreductase [Actinocatenispora rupis]|uniref:FAD-dependent oxidoreductase n=1 Tax=Actinocatenispora rupis TaxID=519421 RepID=A0A8J3JA42_9ACTN|nr:FAD-dependent oxidoreductase [Actinocatenispora rupis]
MSGASIAGPALAYWLNRYGFAVTVVEKAPAVRGGGYPIDVRGTAVEVIRRMGRYEQLRAAHLHMGRMTFLRDDGRRVTSVRLDRLGGAGGGDTELPRGALTELLYEAVRDDVDLRFGDSIAELDDRAGGVGVRFASGDAAEYDVVLAADGLHSTTRRLVFGPEERFHRYLGHCFAGFEMPNRLGLDREGVISTAPGRTAVLYAAGNPDRVHAFLSFGRAEPPYGAFADPAAQRELVASVFAGGGWEVPRMIAAMRTADDLFFDVVSQIRMPAWSRGRVALVGDAAYAPSFLSGQGSSIALVGAYLLAGELAATSDHRAAFAAYEQRMRPFAEANQALADGGGVAVAPATRRGVWLRHQTMRAAPLLARLGGLGGRVTRVKSALVLPGYAADGAVRSG